MEKEKNKTFVLKVTKPMCMKVYPSIKPGDNIEVSFTDKIYDGNFVLVSHNEKQWIERYFHGLKKYNVYPIIKVIMRS